MNFAAAAAFLCLACNVASALEPKLLNLASLSSIVHSEAENEFMDDNILENAAMFELDKQEALYRRRLQAGGHDVPSRFPAFVCEHSPSMDAHERGERVAAGLNCQHGLRIIYNQEDMTCFEASLDFADLGGAPDDLTVHPYLHPMKLGPNVVMNVMEDVAHHVARGFDIDLCHGRGGGGDQRAAAAEKLRSGLLGLFELESEAHSGLSEGFFWNNDDNRRKLRETVGSGKRRMQADVWVDALDGSEGSEACLNSIQHIHVKEGKDLHTNFLYVNGAVTFVDSVASQFEDAEEGKAHGVQCLLTAMAFMAQQPEVCHVGNKPKIQTFNTQASWITQSGTQGSTPFYDKGIRGQGQVVQISDTGLDRDNCYFGETSGSVIPTDGTFDPSKRKVVKYNPLQICYSSSECYFDNKEERGGHGTHVAGTVAGSRADGQAGFADGVAKDAKISFFDMEDTATGYMLSPEDVGDFFGPGQLAGAQLHSASWGSPWNLYTTEDYKYDSYLYNNDEMLMIVAAGNAGEQNGPNSLSTVLSPANAKNIVTVGATESTGKDIEFYQLGQDYVASFSSRGPAGDGRIKPDVMAPGHHILSARAQPDMVGECDSPGAYPEAPGCTWGSDSDGNDVCIENVEDGLMFMQGTSMATPVVSGAAALVRQYFKDGFYPTGSKVPANAITPSGSLVKAVLINSGREIVGVRDGWNGVDAGTSGQSSQLYDEHQGFGRVTLADTLTLGSGGLSTFVVNNEPLARNSNINYEFEIGNCASASDFSVTLTWFDPTGNPNPIIDQDSKVPTAPPGQGPWTFTKPFCANCLVNDLDMKVIKNGVATTFPNGRTSKDSKNNVERVLISNAQSGDTYTVNVRATNIFSATQKFSLVASGCFSESDSTPSPTSPMTPSPSAAPTVTPPALTLQPTPTPVTGEFCEVWVKYKNLHLETQGVDHPGEDMFSNPNIALAFRETVSEVAGAECIDEGWVCYYSAAAVGSSFQPTGLRARRADTTPDSELENISVDFVVTAKVEGSTGCDDRQEEAALAGMVTARILASLGDGSFQRKLRSKGGGTFLETVIVEDQNFDPQVASDTLYTPRVSTLRDRKCTNWEDIQWFMEHFWEIAAAGGAAVALCCICGICFAMFRNQQARRRERKYAAKAMNVRGYAGKNPMATSKHRPQPRQKEGGVSMTTMGYKGQGTRQMTAAQRLANNHGTKMGGGRNKGGKGKGGSGGRSVW
ncbi:hypothetical protein TrRE_jg3824 [Triparma retinervis]|uniref:subtilisin n=1 Tax=Triparma retinervis TaxID=2557542 RepID=A0A9W7A9L3_9STRA|nr:hypothetical protein TrRE_jg3824 [Triparma retinervis]